MGVMFPVDPLPCGVVSIMDKFCIQESSKVYSSCWKFLLCVVVITVSVEIEFGKCLGGSLYIN